MWEDGERCVFWGLARTTKQTFSTAQYESDELLLRHSYLTGLAFLTKVWTGMITGASVCKISL